tara:strand:+ start:22582 stop:23088 length:507 start_codon:yes stop_codon:yes gene_type:complete
MEHRSGIAGVFDTWRLLADPGGISDVIVKILEYDAFWYGAHGGRKIPLARTSCPTNAFEWQEFAVVPYRTNGLSSYGSEPRWPASPAQNEHVDVITRKHPPQDVDLVLVPYQNAEVAHPQEQRSSQHFMTLFRRLDDLITPIEDAMLTSHILHRLSAQDEPLTGYGSS